MNVSEIQNKYGSVNELLPYPSGPGMRIAKLFTRNFIEKFAEWNASFYEWSGRLPIMFNEPQLRGGLCSSFHQAGAIAMPEPPVTRKVWGKGEKIGWADFVIYFGQNNMWILEEKHTYVTYNRYKNTEVNWLTNEWNDALNKINSIKEAPLQDWGEKFFNNFAIVLHSVLIFQRDKEESYVKPLEGNLVSQYLLSVSQKLDPKPNWIWLWSLDEKLQKAEIVEGQWENYPGVGIFMYVKPLEYPMT
jgi:hypothetical protein